MNILAVQNRQSLLVRKPRLAKGRNQTGKFRWCKQGLGRHRQRSQVQQSAFEATPLTPSRDVLQRPFACLKVQRLTSIKTDEFARSNYLQFQWHADFQLKTKVLIQLLTCWSTTVL